MSSLTMEPIALGSLAARLYTSFMCVNALLKVSANARYWYIALLRVLGSPLIAAPINVAIGRSINSNTLLVPALSGVTSDDSTEL